MEVGLRAKFFRSSIQNGTCAFCASGERVPPICTLKGDWSQWWLNLLRSVSQVGFRLKKFSPWKNIVPSKLVVDKKFELVFTNRSLPPSFFFLYENETVSDGQNLCSGRAVHKRYKFHLSTSEMDYSSWWRFINGKKILQNFAIIMGCLFSMLIQPILQCHENCSSQCQWNINPLLISRPNKNMKILVAYLTLSLDHCQSIPEMPMSHSI